MMTKPAKRVRCAVYTRVSTEYGLDQEFNSLDAQHEAAEAYIRSQLHEGWTLVRTRYDDGGYSGGSTERPALQRLLANIRDRRIDVVVVYKVDSLTRSLADFAKLVDLRSGHRCRAAQTACASCGSYRHSTTARRRLPDSSSRRPAAPAHSRVASGVTPPSRRAPTRSDAYDPPR